MKNKKYKMYQRPGFFREYFSFAGEMERNIFWSECLTRIIGLLCMSIVVCMVVSLIVPGDVDHVTRVTEIAVCILVGISLLSIAAMTRRRLRNASCSPKVYLWLLVPIVGWIIFICCLCK